MKKTVVSADALHCQKKTCEIVVNRKGEYVFPVKDNQRGLRQKIEHCFSSNKYPVINADTDELEVSVKIEEFDKHMIAYVIARMFSEGKIEFVGDCDKDIDYLKKLLEVKDEGEKS